MFPKQNYLEFDQMKRNIDYLNGQVKKIDGLKGEIKDISEKIVIINKLNLQSKNNHSNSNYLNIL